MLLSVLVMMAIVARSAGAEDARSDLFKRFGMRVGGGVAFFVSTDQVGWLAFNRPGFVGDLSFSLLVRSWLSAELGGTIGMFMSGTAPGALAAAGLSESAALAAPGGLLAPWLGARLHGKSRRLVPFLRLGFGPGFTGDLVRPLFQTSIGADVGFGAGASVGPVVGYSQMFQKDYPGASTDARFLWVGLSFTYRPRPTASPAETGHVHPPQRVVEVQRVVEHDVQREETYVPAPAAHVEDSELSELLERALPAPRGRVDLFAPVLFKLDSSALEPLGVAMLHEVAELLERRTDVELVAIHGYADRRGSAEHNHVLATRRAERVREWLTAHGIAAHRLVVAEGTHGLVEDGDSESEHEQNRRVIFRILRLSGTP